MPSQLLAAAVMAFRTLVQTIQGTEDQSNQLNQMVSSLSDMATMFERVATTTAAFEQQFNQQASTSNQVQQLQQQVNQQATINGQLSNQMNDLRQLVQTTQSANPPKKWNAIPAGRVGFRPNLLGLSPQKKTAFLHWKLVF